MAKFLIRRTDSGFKFDLKANNGETVATSEIYSSAAACRKGIESVRKCAATAGFADLTAGKQASNPVFELYADRAGQYRFRLRSRNGKVVAVSEGYAAKAACENGIDAVRRSAPEAELTEKY